MIYICFTRSLSPKSSQRLVSCIAWRQLLARSLQTAESGGLSDARNGQPLTSRRCGRRPAPQCARHAMAGRDGEEHNCDPQYRRKRFSGRHAVETAWWAMRSAMRSWGSQSEPDFADSIQRQGFPVPRAGQRFCAEAQRHDLQQAIIYDARVALWEQACVAVSLGL